MEDILYVYGDSLYVNLTNKCPCRCTFCIRSQKEGLGTAESLWLDHDPTAEEVLAAFGDYDLSAYQEVIFCGYGEPMCALDTLLAVCRYLRGVGGVKIRVNTNGLGDLIHGKPTAPLLEGLVDAVSVSLNTSDAEKYNAVCRPSFGPAAYDAMLQFAVDCKRYVPAVKFSIVDVIPPDEIEICKQTAARLGIPLRIRHFSDYKRRKRRPPGTGGRLFSAPGVRSERFLLDVVMLVLVGRVMVALRPDSFVLRLDPLGGAVGQLCLLCQRRFLPLRISFH